MTHLTYLEAAGIVLAATALAAWRYARRRQAEPRLAKHARGDADRVSGR